MGADLIFFILLAFLAIPGIGAYYAQTRGRSFWLWFLIGTILPGISYIILILLPENSDPLEEELEKLRIDLRMLGTSPDIPINDPYRSQIQYQEIKEITFQPSTSSHDGEKRLEILVNGSSLVDLLVMVEKPYSKQENIDPGAYVGLAFVEVTPPSQHLLGWPDQKYRAADKRTVLLVDDKTGQHNQWAFAAEIREYRRHIVWCNFMQVQRPNSWRYDRLGIMVFDKLQYLDALHELMEVGDE